MCRRIRTRAAWKSTTGRGTSLPFFTSPKNIQWLPPNSPATVVGIHAGETLRRLLHYLDPHPDPVRYEGRTKPGSS